MAAKEEKMQNNIKVHVFLRSLAILLTTCQLPSQCYKLLYKHWKKQSEVYKSIIIMLQAFISFLSFTSLKHRDGESLEKCDPALDCINSTSIILSSIFFFAFSSNHTCLA